MDDTTFLAVLIISLIASHSLAALVGLAIGCLGRISGVQSEIEEQRFGRDRDFETVVTEEQLVDWHNEYSTI